MNNSNRRPLLNKPKNATGNTNKPNKMMWVIGAFVVIVIAFVIYSHLGSTSKTPPPPPPPPPTPETPETPETSDDTDVGIFNVSTNAENGDKTYNISSDLTGNPDTKFTDTFNGKKICMYGKCTEDTCESQTESIVLELTSSALVDGTYEEAFDNGYQINWKVGDSSCENFFAGISTTS